MNESVVSSHQHIRNERVAHELLKWPNSNGGTDVIKQVLLNIIGFYQRWISPMMAPHCRFYPTCSGYAQEAIIKHGVLKGGFLAIRRLSKCHPWHPGGIDLVPDECSCNGKNT